MTATEVTGPGSQWRDSVHQPGSKVVAALLVAVLALAPLPFGSNIPLAWGVVAVAAGLLLGAYGVALWISGHGPRFAPGRLLPEGILFGLLCLWLAVQALPLGALVPIAFTGRQGQTVLAAHLSLAPGATWLMLLRMGTYLSVFIVTLQLSVNSRRGGLMLRAIYFAIVFYAVLGLYMLTQMNDTFFGIRKLAYLGSATATFLNRNSYATFLAFGAVIGLALVAGDCRAAWARAEDDGAGLRRIRAGTWVVAIGWPLVLVALVASQSRMGLVAGLAGCAAVMLLALRGVRFAARVWLVGLALLTAVLAVAGLLFGTQLVDRLVFIAQGLGGRLDIYREVLAMIAARPLLGYGGGSFELAFPLFHAPPLPALESYDKAHSTYLGLWADLGIVGGTLPMVVVAGLCLRALRALSRNADGSALSLAGLGVVAVGSLHSLVDFSLEIEANTLVYVAVLAMAVARMRQHPG